MRRVIALVAAGALLVGLIAYLPMLNVGAQESTPGPAGPVEVTLQDAAGQEVGTATFEDVENGVRVVAELQNLPPGEHGIHVHGVGLCDPAGDEPFAAAGDHFNPVEAPHGAPPAEEELAAPADEPVAHAGDLGNVTIAEDGTGTLDVVSNRFTLGEGATTLAGQSGTALLVHENPDDLTTQPSGDSGPRLACGVIFPSLAGTPAAAAASPAASPADAAAGAGDAGGGETLTVLMGDIFFDPKELTIPADTDVTIVLPNNGAAVHNFVIDEGGIDSGDVAPGDTVELVINLPAGEYEYYCDIPGHRAAGMWGTLIVE